MNSQANTGFLEGPFSESSAVARRHNRAGGSRRYAPRNRRGARGVMLESTSNPAAHSVVGAALQTLGYLALTSGALWMIFAYVP